MPPAVPLPPAPPRHGRVRRPLSVLSLLAVLVGLLSAVALPASLAVASPSTVTPGSKIEAFAPYQGQKACEPIARPGVKAFRDLVLDTYPDTRDAGIARACHVGGTSEHKEGRAWDWRVSTSSDTDVEAAEDLFEWLLAEDEHGNEAAMARRLGVMYIIWDSQVWKSYAAAKGWQPYSGGSPHTDHVHISFSWAGALKMTSYWTGEVAPVVPSPIVVLSPSPSATPSGSASPPASSTGQLRTLVPPSSPSPSASPSPAASPTPSAVPVPAASAAVRPAQRTSLSGDDRRAVVRSLPGPWRRH